MLQVHAKKLGSIAILRLQGRIVRGQSESLRAGLPSLSGISTLVLDLASVNTIDAAGLALLLELREQSQVSGIEFRLSNVTRLVNQVLEITRLDSVFETSTDLRMLAAASSSHGVSAHTMACCACR